MCEMFDRKFVVVIFLLFIMHVSFVSANECNETDTILEIDDNQCMSVNNDSICENDSVYDDYDESILDFNQGDKIPITVDSPVEGNLTVLIDNEIYGIWSFSKNETIYIPTYNSASFYNSSIKNINVGDYKMSLIFKLNTFNNYIPIISEEDSHLNFQFHIYDDIILNNKYTYTHNATLTIFEKRKTVELFINSEYYYHVSVNCGVGVGLDISFSNISWKDRYENYSFGLILSDQSRTLFKKDIGILEANHLGEFIESYEESKVWCVFLYDFPGLSHDILRNIGVCNLTVINFVDGTSDSILFNVSKFYNYVEKMDCIIQDSDVTFYFYQYFPRIFISVDEIGKFISPINNCWNVTFTGLSPGVHVMKLYYINSDYSKEFLCNVTFKIHGGNDNFYDNTLHFNNISYNMFGDMVLSDNDGLFSSSGVLNFQDMDMIVNSDSRFNGIEGIGKFNNNAASISVGGSMADGFSDGSDNVKSYEVSKKSVSESKDNLLTKLCLTLISCMSFIGGYVRFEKNEKNK